MSITLPVVDLSSAVIGTTGSMPLQPFSLVSVTSQDSPVLHIFNDSGAGLLITLKKSQLQFYLSAKGHIAVAISNAEGQIDYLVQNISTNIQVNQLWAVYYYPGEDTADFTALGTSSVSQQATTLQNTGNPVGTIIVFSEPLGDASAIGAVNLNNIGQLILGDTTYAGSISLKGPGTAGAIQLNNGTQPNFLMLSPAGIIDIDIEPGSTALAGGTSGTATLYQIFRGTYKYTIIKLAAFRTAGANQNISFPTAYTGNFYVHCGDTELFSLQASGVDVGTRTITALPAGAGAAATTVASTTMNSHGLYSGIAAFDSIQFKSGWVANRTGLIIIEGV